MPPTTALDQGLPPERTVAVDTAFGLEGRRTLMTTPVTEPRWRDLAHALLAADGTPVTVIADSPGFVAQRVIATIVNIGCDIAQQGIAIPGRHRRRGRARARLSARAHLVGGLSWVPPGCSRSSKRSTSFYRDPRYRPSPWLIRRARLGVPLATVAR